MEKLNWHDLYDPIGNSMKLCRKAMEGDASFVNETLDRNHEELASRVSKYDENVLSAIVVTSYYRARDYYDVRKEENGIDGRSDVSFFPRKARFFLSSSSSRSGVPPKRLSPRSRKKPIGRPGPITKERCSSSA